MGQGIRVYAKELQIAYGDFVALKIPDLDISGKVVALVGHNGSGKSTFIKAMLKLLEPRSGELSLFWGGETLVPEQHMAFSPENGAVFADISVKSYLELWGRLRHGNKRYYLEECATYLDKLHIRPLLPKLGRELSKGQRRRVQVVAGFITNPRLFLFDEPFDGLDIQQATELADILNAETEKMSLVISSHRMDVVERLADIVIVLKCGEVYASGDIPSVIAKLAPGTASLTDAMNVHLRQYAAELNPENL